MPEDYECLKGITLNDIPKQFIQAIRMPQAYQGIVIDAPDSKIFKKAAKYIDTIPESARGMFLEEIN